jgi:hypothetical protein
MMPKEVFTTAQKRLPIKEHKMKKSNNADEMKNECAGILLRNGVGSETLKARPVIHVSESEKSGVGVYRTKRIFIESDGTGYAKDYEEEKGSPVVVYIKDGKDYSFFGVCAQEILDKAEPKSKSAFIHKLLNSIDDKNYVSADCPEHGSFRSANHIAADPQSRTSQIMAEDALKTVEVRERKTPRKHLRTPLYLASMSWRKVMSRIRTTKYSRDWKNENIYHEIIEKFSVEVESNRAGFELEYGDLIARLLSIAELYRIPFRDIYDKVYERSDYIHRIGKRVSRNERYIGNYEGFWRRIGGSLRNEWDKLLAPSIAKDQKMIPTTNEENELQLSHKQYKRIAMHLDKSKFNGIRDLVVIEPNNKYLLRFVGGANKTLFLLRYSSALSGE